jgi:S-adenosylmethionine:tRNA ribosyltransferase-isomerase
LSVSTPYDFFLPPELIAQQPATRRADARLLLVRRNGDVIGETRFRSLPDFMHRGDVLVVNDSRVLPARLRLRRLESSGRIELLLVRPLQPRNWLALARPSRRLRPGSRLGWAAASGSAAPDIVVTDVHGEGFVTVSCEQDLTAVAESRGDVPLPPYIKRSAADPRLRSADRRRYQTVYARSNGSVAAPTAGLHFDRALLAALRVAGVRICSVTLHVGPGTFRAPTAQQLRAGRLHAEMFHYPAATDSALREARAAKRRIIAVGTTSLRVLATVGGLDLAKQQGDRVSWSEGAPEAVSGFTGEARRLRAGWDVRGLTRLFLRPPERITAVDGLVTNFHLPGSSLLMLVAAFAGPEVWRPAYDFAVRRRYRFYSYGDAMLIVPAEPVGAGRRDRDA